MSDIQKRVLAVADKMDAERAELMKESDGQAAAGDHLSSSVNMLVAANIGKYMQQIREAAKGGM